MIWLCFSLWCLIVFSHMLCHITLRWIGAVSPAGGWQIEKNKSDIWAKLDFLSTNNTKKRQYRKVGGRLKRTSLTWQAWFPLNKQQTNKKNQKKEKNINKQTNKQTNKDNIKKLVADWKEQIWGWGTQCPQVSESLKKTACHYNRYRHYTLTFLIWIINCPSFTCIYCALKPHNDKCCCGGMFAVKWGEN